MGVFTVVRQGEGRGYLGLPRARITELEIILTDDATKTRRGQMLYRGALQKVGAKDGSVASASGTVMVSGGRAGYPWGDRLRIVGSPRPGEETGVDWTVRVTEGGVRSLGPASRYFMLRSRIREWIAMRCEGLSNEDRALFMALFLGAREDLAGQETHFFRRAGAIHLLALSGFHLGILSFILVGVLSRLLGKRRAVVVASLFLAAYLFVAGPKVSLLRAVLMFTILGVCRLAYLRVRGTDVLGTTFLICLLAWPESLDTLSFQLSYLALAGILVLTPTLDRILLAYLPRLVRSPACAAVGAQIATAPVLAARFGLLYPIGLLSSLILTPLVTGFLWGGVAYVFLPLPTGAAHVLAELLRLNHLALGSCAELFARVNPVRATWSRGLLLVAAALLAPVLFVSLARPRATGERMVHVPTAPPEVGAVPLADRPLTMK